jgi:hypothetical protein
VEDRDFGDPKPDVDLGEYAWITLPRAAGLTGL